MFYICSLPNPGIDGNPKELFTDDPSLIERFAKAENRPGRGVYDCIGTLKDGVRSRCKDNVVELEQVVVDLDLKNIVEPRDDVIKVLQGLLLPPSEIRDSGFGLHAIWRFKEAVNDAAGLEQAERIMARLVEMLAGDPAPTHRAALLRHPGSDNFKDGSPRKCHAIEQTNQQYDVSEFEDMFDLYGDQRQLTAKPKPATNGHNTDHSAVEYEGPVDVDAELASIHDGAGANKAQRRVVPSLLRKMHPDEVLDYVVNGTLAAPNRPTKWTREIEVRIVRKRILSAYNNLLLKGYDPSTGIIPDWLPGEFHVAWIDRLQQGRRPAIGFNPGGFYVRSQERAEDRQPHNDKDRASEDTDKPKAKAEQPKQEQSKTGETNGERKYRFRLIGFQDMRPGLEPVYLVDELIPSAGLVLLWGKQKTYKSFWLLDLMLHVAMGWPYRDRAVRQGAVIYCAFEGAHGYKGRAEALRRHYGIADSVQVPLHIMPGQADLIHDEKTLIADFRAQLGDIKPLIVVLDTLNRSLKGSENSDEDMTKYTRAAEAIRAAFGCVVIIVHHCGYDETHSRGHTSLPAAVDAELSVTRGEGSPLFLVTVKNMRDGPEGTTVRCRAQIVPLDADQDGRPRSSIVVVADDSPVDPSTKGRRDSGYPVLMNAMRLALAADGVQFHPDGKMPVRAVAETHVRAAFYRNYIDAEDDKKKSADAQKAAFKRALRKAIDGGVLCGQNDNRGTPMLWFVTAEENYR